MKITETGFGRRLFDRNLDLIETIEVEKEECPKLEEKNCGQ